MLFDRVALINLDQRVDRLGSFRAKLEDIPCLHEYIRYRAVDGNKTSVPGFFISGGGAYGCRQSHLRVLEDALMDNVNTLLVLEDDVRFCRDFEQKLRAFLLTVPDDWHGLMIGGQDQATPTETGIPGVARSVDTQRTHAFIVRGKEAMQSLYQIWARSDRHVDHLLGTWQSNFNVYQPVPFLCGQDDYKSDISGRSDGVRYWDAAVVNDTSTPIYVVSCDRATIERLRVLGLHTGYSRDPIKGYDKGLIALSEVMWPAEQLTEWASLIAYQAHERYDVPGIWFSPLPERSILDARMGRPVKHVTADTVQQGVEAIPALLPQWLAANIVWCWQGRGQEILEGLNHHGFHRGRWKDEITGLDNGIRNAVDNDRYMLITGIVRQLTFEITKVRYGKVLLAHPALDVARVRDELPGSNVQELTGSTLNEIMTCYKEVMKHALSMYRN